MIHERPFHRIDCRNARTNAGDTTTPPVTAPGSCPQCGAGGRGRSSRSSSRSDTTDEGARTATDRSGGSVTDSERTRIETILPPAVYREGQTVTASGPTDGVVERFLQAVYRNTPPVDGVIVLTTERSASEVLRAYTGTSDEKRAGIGIIDTRSADQYIEDIYRESPIHYTAADSDIERTAMSVAELVEALSTSPAQRLHLIVDSYTALCESLSARDRTQLLNTFHSQIDGYGIYTTDGDAAADDVLRRWMKGSIWVEEDPDGGTETRYRRV